MNNLRHLNAPCIEFKNFKKLWHFEQLHSLSLQCLKTFPSVLSISAWVQSITRQVWLLNSYLYSTETCTLMYMWTAMSTRVAIEQGCPADKQCHLLAATCIAVYWVPNGKVGKRHFAKHHLSSYAWFWLNWVLTINLFLCWRDIYLEYILHCSHVLCLYFFPALDRAEGVSQQDCASMEEFQQRINAVSLEKVKAYYRRLRYTQPYWRLVSGIGWVIKTSLWNVLQTDGKSTHSLTFINSVL